MEQKRSILSIEAVPQTRLRYARGIRLKENYDAERKPRCNSFNRFIAAVLQVCLQWV